MQTEMAHQELWQCRFAGTDKGDTWQILYCYEMTSLAKLLAGPIIFLISS
jgi:hypothetical protein